MIRSTNLGRRVKMCGVVVTGITVVVNVMFIVLNNRSSMSEAI